ncbi:RNA polymerase sigma-B factor [subsurface metagenome]
MRPKGYARLETNRLLALYKESMDLAARDRLVADHLALVRRLCRKFNHSGEPMEDLIQVGAIGLLKAIEKYDPARGNAFVAFAIPEIVGEIKNYFRDHGWAVKVPRKLQRQKMVVEKTVEVLNQRLGRWPTIPEIAEATGFSEEDVYDTFELEKYGKPLSLDAEYYRDGNGDSSSLLDYLGSEDPQFEELEYRMILVKAFDSLNEREKTVIDLRFYEGLSQTEIAERLGISQMHVSRLQRLAISKLKQNLEE